MIDFEKTFRNCFRLSLAALLFASASQAMSGELYKAESGPYEIEITDSVDVPVANQERRVALRISHPSTFGAFPLVVFSHGAFCSIDGYSRVADHWASHGYVVILPAHLDSGALGRIGGDQMNRIFLSRLADMSAVLDALALIEAEVPTLKGKIDSERVASAGHSMGALVATALTGLDILDPGGNPISFQDKRFDVSLLLSGPGPLPIIPENAWSKLVLPTFVYTGTHDQTDMAGPTANWSWRLSTYRLTPPGDKYALVLSESDHFFGNLICPVQAQGGPDYEALTIVKSTSTAFLDSYLKGSTTARAFLRENQVAKLTNGRAQLRFR